MAAGEGSSIDRRDIVKPVRKLVWSAVILISLMLAVLIGFWARPLSYFNALTSVQLRLAGAHSRSVTVGGNRLHYYVMGPAEGRPVVLVHGLGGRCEDWRNLVPYLVREGFRVYMPDLPGFGRSDKPANFSYSIPDQAATMFSFMDAMGLTRVDLGGFSMGGWIVQKMAADHPDRIARLMLFDAAGINEVPVWNTRLFTPTSAVELDQLDDLLMPHPPQVPGFIAADILRVSRQDAWVIQRALDSMLSGRDATDDVLPQLKMPVLIVWGNRDQIFPLRHGERMHQLIPQSQLDVVPGCGHLAPVQCADRIGPTMAQFLK
jgi:pimeloyl-ACP methyl ester carboxylesterase